jgi:hypothetical protein
MMTTEQFNQILKAIEQGNWRLLWLLLLVLVIWSVATAIQHRWIKRIEAAVENRQHFSRLRYEREIEIYRKAWKSLFDFYEASGKLLVGVPPQSPALKEWVDLRNKLVEVIRYDRPFYPDEMHQQLKSVQLLCEDWAYIKENPTCLNDEDRGKFIRLHPKIKSQMESVEEMIRARLSKFDGAIG